MKLSEEAQEKIDEIKADGNSKIREILKVEANNNNPYQVGDVLEDHYQIGIVEEIIIRTNAYKTLYDICYSCTRLTKKLTPYRGGEKTIIYLCNVERKIK